MHELGLMSGVLDAIFDVAKQNHATAVLKVTLTVGEMTEVVDESLRFAFEVLTEDTIAKGATLEVTYVKPRSRCFECGAEYEHSRFEMVCPKCESPFTELLCGRELAIDSVELDLPD